MRVGYWVHPRKRVIVCCSRTVTYKPKGKQRLRGAAWPGSTSLSLLARRFCLVLLEASRWRKPGVRRISLPVEESLKRLATDFFVFCMGWVWENRLSAESWQGENRGYLGLYERYNAIASWHRGMVWDFETLHWRLPSSMVEQLTLNQLVPGSSPGGATNEKFIILNFCKYLACSLIRFLEG